MNIHPTTQIYDSTKIQTAQRCFRKAFFRFVLGWAPKEPSKHLVHGRAWHKGLDYILTSDYTREDAAMAGIIYEKEYRKDFHENMDIDNFPKSPGPALLAYDSYVEKYRNEKDFYEVLYTELPGSVPVDDKHNIYFKLDAVFRERKSGKIVVTEHKTSSRNSVIDKEQWTLKTQIGTYTHAAICMFGAKNVKYVMINRTFFYKASPSIHDRFPVMKSKQSMDGWLWDTTHMMHLFDFELERLDKCKESDPILKAFPKNPEACTDYMTMCPYFDVCMSGVNPLKREVPDNMKVEYWDPREREEESPVVFKDGKVVIKEDMI